MRLVKERQLNIYECKGYQRSNVVREEEISDWLERRVPIINSAHRFERRFDNSSTRFEFWTCGTFDEDTLSLLQIAKDRTRKYGIDWSDGLAVRQYAKGMIAPGIKKVLNEHYFDNPLAAIPDTAFDHQPCTRWNTSLKEDVTVDDDLDFDLESLMQKSRAKQGAGADAGGDLPGQV